MEGEGGSVINPGLVGNCCYGGDTPTGDVAAAGEVTTGPLMVEVGL